MKTRKRLLIPLFLILMGVGVYLLFFNRDPNSGRLVISGNIEVTDARLSFKIPGRLLERVVDEGETAKAGQIVARLESQDQEIALAQAEANLAYSRAVLSELEAGSRVEDIRRAKAQVNQTRSALLELKRGSRNQEIGDARAEVERAAAAVEGARTQMELASGDHERYRKLYEDGVISLREYDIIRKKFDTARSAHEEALARLASAKERLSLREEGPRKEQIAQAQAALRQVEAAYALVKAGPREETIEQARAKVKVAEEGLRQAQQQLSYTQLPAPFDGMVLSKAAEPGEYLNIGSTVITIADLQRVWLRAYVNERDLGRVALGQEVEVRTDTFPDKVYRGRVSFINSEAEFTPKAVQTTDERVKLVYRIKIDLPNPNQELKPGMPADAVIEAGQGHDGQ
ncbi:MAG: efflux RND transporter periplasmic adaptor subunit [Deltaproteobacteria bacterium]|nr:efflux RND transporter periplasmic adaptor subunit [Deltaproteobacteria bacterium]